MVFAALTKAAGRLRARIAGMAVMADRLCILSFADDVFQAYCVTRFARYRSAVLPRC